jgi:NAD-dependent dihydropyrimidine dehydrogenase PreA subunit
MTYIITTPCIDVQDQSCVEVCPVDCIHFEEDKDRILYINPDECIDCGACEPACPVTAIFAEDDVPDDQQAFIAINVQWFEGDKDEVRARVNELAPA